MKNRIIIQKILGYIEKVLNYTNGYTYDKFAEDTILIEACVFNLSQMGELANKIDNDFKTKHQDIPWKFLYALRNRIVHDYEGVNLVLIWDILENDLIELKTQLIEIMD